MWQKQTQNLNANFKGGYFMKNTFKKIIAVISSAAVLMANTATFSVCAVEEETTAQKYTLEELLPMSKEEIYTISEDAAEIYDDFYTNFTGSYFGDMLLIITYYDQDAFVYIDENGYEQVNEEALLDNLGYSASCVKDISQNTYGDGNMSYVVRVIYTTYPEYEPAHVSACVNLLLFLNPDIDISRTFEDPIVKIDDIIGDVNGDNRVNAMDASLVARYSIGDKNAATIIVPCADVNADGNVNAMDATLIARYAVGEIESFE